MNYSEALLVQSLWGSLYFIHSFWLGVAFLSLHSYAVCISFSQIIDEYVLSKRTENCENQNISHSLLLALLHLLDYLIYQKLDYLNCLFTYLHTYLCVCLYEFRYAVVFICWNKISSWPILLVLYKIYLHMFMCMKIYLYVIWKLI